MEILHQFVMEPWDEIVNLEDVDFQLQKFGTIQMHILQSIITNKRVKHL